MLPTEFILQINLIIQNITLLLDIKKCFEYELKVSHAKIYPTFDILT